MNRKYLISLVSFLLPIFMSFSSTGYTEELTIASWGNAYSKSQVDAYINPYMGKTGVEIKLEEYSEDVTATLKAMAESGNVSWHVVDVSAAEAIRLCNDGLAKEVDHNDVLAAAPDGTTPVQDFGEFIVSPCFVPQVVDSVTLAYRNDANFEETPKSVCDIFDTKNLKGKRALQKSPQNNIEWALLCDGVPRDNLYDVLSTEEGLNRAFAKLDTIKDDIVWWSSPAETPQLLADGDIAIGSSYNTRFFSLIEEQNASVSMLWDGQILDVGGWIIPEGISPEKSAQAKDYIKFATDTQRLADQAKYISYGPARTSSAKIVGKHDVLGVEMAPHMPTSPENISGSILKNFAWWSENEQRVQKKFNAWVSKPKIDQGKSSKAKAKVKIIYGTNRKKTNDSLPKSQFNSRLNNKITYGVVEVEIPESHLIGNIRDNGSTTSFLSLSYWKNWLFGEDQTSDFLVSDNTQLEFSELQDLIRDKMHKDERTGFIYIHGFATSFDFAAKRTAQLAFDLKQYNGVPMFFSWPSVGSITKKKLPH